MKILNSQLIKSAMLMAAGIGSRLRPFTNFQTKALLPVMGVPVAQYTVDSLVHAGVERVVANIHHQGNGGNNEGNNGKKSAAGLAALEYGAAQLSISDESLQLLGSAGGIRKALNFFGGRPFFLANADVLCEVNWSELAACHQRLRSESGVVLTLAVFPVSPPGTLYREIHFNSATGLITSLGQLGEGCPYFVGAAVLEVEAVAKVPNGVPSDFVEAILKPAIAQGRAGVFASQGSWFDMGEPKLWFKTHFALMELLERNQGQPGGSPNPWKERLLRNNFRLAKGIWTSRSGGGIDHSKWIGPCYWSGGGGAAPPLLGPDAILYGSAGDKRSYSRGIGYGGEWITIE